MKLGDYASLMCELLADNADPLTPAVYEAVDMPFVPLMHRLAQAWKQSRLYFFGIAGMVSILR